MNFRKTSAATIAALMASSLCFAHLPSANDASLIMGRTGGGVKGGALRATYSDRGAWSPTIEDYKGSWQEGQGDTVTHGTFNNIPMKWWAKFAADKGVAPGEFAAEGGTSPWVLINSLAGGGNKFTAVTWNGGGTNPSTPLNNIGSMQAKVPTWRDGANGAYSITLDDIGAMPFEKSIQPGWDLTKGSDIKMAWGVFVGNMSDADWKRAIEMVAEGNEMFNHSMDHTSAADQWQIYYPGQMVSRTDPAIPPSVRGLEVVGTWKIASTVASGNSWAEIDLGPSSWNGTKAQIDTTSTGNTGNPVLVATTVNGAYDGWKENTPSSSWADFTITASSDMVSIKMPGYWTGYDPATGIAWNDPRIQITPKSSYNGIPIQTVELAGGQKVYVAYTNYNANAGKYEGYQEGYIAATGVQWFEEGKLLDDYPFYFNGLYVKTDWNGSCAQSGCDKSGTPGRQVSHLDKGRPGFVAKMFCIEGWDNADGNGGRWTKRNVDTANYIINENIYKNITSAGEYFPKGKRSEYFGYPFDAYSEKTHDYLFHNVEAGYAGRFVGARGGAKSGAAMPGDFFHPFRIDFDAFFINNKNWTAGTSDQAAYKVPNNAHVLLGINELVDDAVKANGYMIRELHAVADIQNWYDNTDNADSWPINNNGLAQGGWWGGITKQQLGDHFTHVQSLIDQKKLTVFTPSEAVKYRMTANAIETDATLTKENQNWKLKLTKKSGNVANVDDIHKEEISVIVNLGESVSKLAVSYDGTTTNTSEDNSPRRRPRKMDANGQIWSVSINPFKNSESSALLIKDGDWRGQETVYNDNPDNILKPTGVQNVATKTVRMTFAGIRNGQIALNLSAGNYVAELYNVQGRLVGRANVNALDGVNVTTLKTTNLGKGIMILNVKDAKGAAVIQHKLMLK